MIPGSRTQEFITNKFQDNAKRPESKKTNPIKEKIVIEEEPKIEGLHTVEGEEVGGIFYSNLDDEILLEEVEFSYIQDKKEDGNYNFKNKRKKKNN